MQDLLEMHMTSLDSKQIEFKKDIHFGLSQSQKTIPSKYFYDQQGSELFNQITRHPDYYLTGCEIEILREHKNELATLMSNFPNFNLIELGPGEGIKSEIIMQHFAQHKMHFTYIPVDISKKYLQQLRANLDEKIPGVIVQPLHADYLNHIHSLELNNQYRNLILFLGSSIGNFTPELTRQFLQQISRKFNKGDYFLLGLDLRKDISVLMKAYDDDAGITRKFNMNLLKRINKELSGDFDLAEFSHYATYNVHAGAMESYLVSLKKQIVTLRGLEFRFPFEKMEAIHVESSYKYLPCHIRSLAHENGFELIQNFIDKKEYFLDTLWRIK